MADLAPFSKDNNPNIRELTGGYTLSNLKTLLSVADKHGFGIPACNARHKTIAEAILDAAWEAKSPIIIEIAESESGYCPMQPDMLSDIVHNAIEERIAKYGYSVPVCLHHDHIQKDVDGCIQKSIDAGFSSVEVDLSKLPTEENAAKCREVVEKIHPLGISIEVEEGEIGAASALADPDVEQNIANYYTKTEDAVKLVEGSKPEALAFFVGNGHGVYLKEPHLGFDRIKEICDQIRPLGAYGVLHGGSGISPEMFQKAVEAGARKFNYATTLQNIWFKYFPQELTEAMDKAAKENEKPFRKVLYMFIDEVNKLDHTEAKKEIAEHLKMMFKEAFLCDGKADLYN
ncbi:class II fructose-bisphosphate aldolase [Patescibacteria group bacterium]